MGPLHISTGDSLTTGIHALQTVSGNYVHKIEEETITYDENYTTTLSGREYRKGTLFGAFGEALLGPNRFIADVKVTADVENGIPVGEGCAFFISQFIQGEETKLGWFGTEAFHLTGRPYEKRVK
jgi:hypothetical protein